MKIIKTKKDIEDLKVGDHYIIDVGQMKSPEDAIKNMDKHNELQKFIEEKFAENKVETKKAVSKAKK